VIALVLMASACSSAAVASNNGGRGRSACPSGSVHNGADGDTVVDVVQRVARENGLTSVLYRVTRARDVVASGAYGDTLTGVTADPSLHFRIGNVAFGYMGTLLLRLVEDGKAALDDPISKWLPDTDLPTANNVTLRMLVQNTSGYPDYVRNDGFEKPFDANPFAQWTPQQLIDVGLSTPPYYPPGTAWSYAHTNYMILGQALAAIGGDDLGSLIADQVIKPLHLKDTTPARSPDMPAPILHSYSTERGPFEETTFWNPSWQTAPGGVITSTICDIATSAAAIGSGQLLEQSSYAEMVTPAQAMLRPRPPSCSACRQWSRDTFYGLGVIVSNGWVYQAPLFGGAGGIAASLPDQDLTVALEAVSGKDTKSGKNVAMQIWQELAQKLTPDHVPGPPVVDPGPPS
jgi:CubicO group peptidase (beta-lactamase class C family)